MCIVTTLTHTIFCVDERQIIDTIEELELAQEPYDYRYVESL